MTLTTRFPKTCLTLLIIIVAVLVTIFVPLGRNPRWIYRFNNTEIIPVNLAPGATAIQTMTMPTARLSGVRFFVDSQTPVDQPDVRLLNDQGQLITKAHGYTYEYYQGHLEVTALIPWQKVVAGEHIQLAISHKSAQAIQLLTIVNSHYARETLTADTPVKPGQTIPLEIMEPVPEPAGARQGVLAASFLLLASVFVFEFFRDRSWREWPWLMVILAATTPLLLAGFWFSKGPLGINDWDYYFSLHTIWRNLLVVWHQFPQWNPYTCGGTAALGDPEFSVFTPTFLLEFIFGVPTGLRLAIYVSTAVGAIGMLQVARRVGLSSWAALLASIIAFFGTVNLLEITEGHVNIFAAMWIPWVFWSWLGAYRSGKVLSRHLLWCSLFLALTFYQGGIYLLFYTLIAFVLMPLVFPRPWQAIKVTAAAGVLALGLAALKLVPVLLWLKQFPDQGYASAPYSIGSTIDILFGRYLHGATVVPDQVAGWHEYGAYIGYLVFALAIIGLSYIRQKPLIRKLLLATIFFWIISTIGPLWVPLFDRASFLPRSMVTRMILFSILPLSLLAGFGLDRIRHRWSSGPTIALIMLCLVTFDVFSLTYQLSDQAFIVPLVYPSLPPMQPPIAFVRKTYFTTLNDGEQHISQYPVSLEGYGTLNYCSVLGPGGHITAIEDERPQTYVQTISDKSQTKVESWTPNKVVVSIQTPEATRVILNTNYADGWVVNQKPALEFEGRVSTMVDPGNQVLTFEYHTPGLNTGIVFTIIALGLLAYFWSVINKETAKATQTSKYTETEKVAG